MRILFLGDYSNLHTTLARELRRMGHHADVLSDGCVHMKVEPDFLILREKGLWGSFKYLYDIFTLLPKLKDYDVVQLINTNFLKLRPPKLKYIFDRIKEQNKAMFLTLAGNDYYYAKACYEGKIFRFSEFKIGNEFTPGHKENPGHLFGWMSHQNKYLAEHVYGNIKGAMSVLPEYDMATRHFLGDKLKFTNLPVDFSELPNNEDKHINKTNILVGIRSWGEVFKGTRYLKQLALEIEKEFPELVNVQIVKDLPLKEYLNIMSQNHIVLDQLYAYSPAMNALYAMAMGKVAGTGAQPEYFDYLGIEDPKSILSISPMDKDIKERLVTLIHNPAQILEMGKKNIQIVKNHNDSKIVAERFLRHWENLL